MHLVLAVRGLAAPAPAPDRAPILPGLARLLAGAGAPAPLEDGLSAALAARYGVTRQSDWPLAAIRLAACGVDPGDAYWLAADPVSLVAGRDDAQVGPAISDFTAAESDALIAALNAHFAADALLFVAPRPDAWFVRAPNVPALSTRPLDLAQGRSLRTQLPVGADAKTWWRWLEEIQMLLFTHPVTAAREHEGRQSANAVWISTGGTRPPRIDPAPSLATFAADELATALAAHIGAQARPLPVRLDTALAHIDAQTAVIAPHTPVDLAAFDRAFATPAADALVRGTLDEVDVLADGDGSARSWTVRRPRWSERIARRFRKPDLAALLAAPAREDA